MPSEIMLFHHAQGLTTGIEAFADDLRAAGHTVHAPDMYEGRVFETLDEGLAHAEEVGFGTVVTRGHAASESLPAELVYIGFSMGVLPAQMLAQTRPGAKGAVLIDACVDPVEFGGLWPSAVPVQVHGMDADQYFAEAGDLDAARSLALDAPDGELFVYTGDRHLFADRSLAAYDEAAAALLTERVLAFLAARG